MSPILNATEIDDENELTEQEEAAGLIQFVALDLPADCKTEVLLQVQQGADGLYRSGFVVIRSYETSPYEQRESCQPASEDAVEGYESLGSAIGAAAETALDWLILNSDDIDENAKEARDYLDSWIGELDEDSVTEAIFDTMEPFAGESAADLPAEPCPMCETPCHDCEATEPAAVSVSVASAPIPPATVTDEAQLHFENRKHHLEEQLAKLAVEEIRLKAAVKWNRESASQTAEDYQEHISRGPERLPLFDRKPAELFDLKKPAESADKHEPDNCTCAPCAAARVAKADAKEVEKTDATPDAEPWRAVTLEELEIPAAICTILHEENNMWSLGDLFDHCKAYDVIDLKKIGKAKAEKIEDAMQAYWAKNPAAKLNNADEAEEE